MHLRQEAVSDIKDGESLVDELAMVRGYDAKNERWEVALQGTAWGGRIIMVKEDGMRLAYSIRAQYALPGRAVQVDISLTPCAENAGFQLLESTVLSKPLVSNINLHPYTGGGAQSTGGSKPKRKIKRTPAPNGGKCGGGMKALEPIKAGVVQARPWLESTTRFQSLIVKRI